MAWDQQTLFAEIVGEFVEARIRFVDATVTDEALAARRTRRNEVQRDWRARRPRARRVRRGRCPIALKAARARWIVKTRQPRGPVACGTALPQAKLDDARVMELRAAWRAGESVRRIAKRSGLAYGTAHPMLTGKTWKHLNQMQAAA